MAEPVGFRWRQYSLDEKEVFSFGDIFLKKYFTIKRMARIAILSALAAILMILDFPTFIAPGSMYKLDFSDLPTLLGGFSMGPLAALIIVILKILIKLLFKPTSTAFVGELANFILSISFCVTASLIYKYHRNKKGALWSLVIGSITMIVVSGVVNYFVLIPFFSNYYGVEIDTIIAMGQQVYTDIVVFFTKKEPSTYLITDKFSFVMFCVIPFNTIKAILVDVVTFVLYKHVSPILKDC